MVNKLKEKPKSGFTFVELMIVSVLIALVGMIVYSAFRQGFALWTRSQYTSRQQMVILLFERFARELNNTFQFEPIGFEGEEEVFSFPGLVQKYDWDWSNKEGRFKDDDLDYNLTTVALPLIAKITYEYDKMERTLVRKEEVYAYPDLDELKMKPDDWEEETSRLIMEDIEEIEFSYVVSKTSELNFHDDFEAEGKMTVPYAVKISLLLKEMKTPLERTVFIPINRSLKNEEGGVPR